MLLSILICTVHTRRKMLLSLLEEIKKQAEAVPESIEVITNDCNDTVGKKRNDLLSQSKGEYVCFIDDDDMITPDYIKHVIEGCKSGKDCVSLRGVITFDGANPELFEHSLKYTAWATTGNPIKYERYPNHLNPIKASIAKQFKYPEINHGEDHDWSTQVHKSGLIKSEHYVNTVMYHYNYVTLKSV